MTPDDELLERARSAANCAYVPYSKFRVGAAVRIGKNIYTGCNIENASYGLTICAERVAVFTAIAASARVIDAVAVACIDAADGAATENLMPCGACRQVIAEFATAIIPFYIDRVGTFTVGDLMPHPFRLTGA